MRFARLQQERDGEEAQTSSTTDRVVFLAYNVIWWVPVALPLLGLISFTAGLFLFLAFSLVRAGVNLYRNNVMPLEAAVRFPLRSP